MVEVEMSAFSGSRTIAIVMNAASLSEATEVDYLIRAFGENKRKGYCTRLIEVLPGQRGHEKEVKLQGKRILTLTQNMLQLNPTKIQCSLL
jgi:hypothetical protein